MALVKRDGSLSVYPSRYMLDIVQKDFRDKTMVRVLLVLACSLLSATASAQVSQPQPSLPCDAFVRDANGCWSPTRQVTIKTSVGNGEISLGMTFCSGTLFMGLNLPEMLNQQCTR
jgi:hypothetical protein